MRGGLPTRRYCTRRLCGSQRRGLGAHSPYLLGMKADTAPGPRFLPQRLRLFPPLLPSSAPSRLQAGPRQSDHKRCLAFYSHRAAPFFVPKLLAIQSGTPSAERGGGAVAGVRRGAASLPAQLVCYPLRPHFGSFRSAAFPARPLEGAPTPLLPAGRLPRESQWRRRRLISRFVPHGRPRMGAGGRRGGFRPGPQSHRAATSCPKVALQ